MIRPRFRVLSTLDGRKANMPTYPLLPGDIVIQDEDGTWTKHAPGLAIGGFELTAEDVAELEAADEARWVVT